MWIAILIIVGLILFGLIRGTIISSGQFQVVNKDGVPWKIGPYRDCNEFAKAQNEYCKSFGINDHFKIVRLKM